MTQLSEIAEKIRSKNAGPFWLTVDIFCGNNTAFETVKTRLATQAVAQAFDIDANTLKRFDIPSLHVVKFSLPRPQVQGSIADRDMHGASWGCMIAELNLTKG